MYSLGKIVIDCGRDTCTQVPWQDPVTYTSIPFWQSGWMLIVGPIVLIAVIIAVSIVRYRRHERLEDQYKESQETERAKAAITHVNCPFCGGSYHAADK